MSERFPPEKYPLYHLLHGVEGEEWPRWLGHLPSDVREQYRRLVVEARKSYEEPWKWR